MISLLKKLLRGWRIGWHKLNSITYLHTPKITFPLKNWQVNSIRFLQPQTYSGVDWGLHLGEDCNVRAGTPVIAIGRGKVVYSALHTSLTPPESEGKKGSNWGNIIIVAHKNPRTKKLFFSLYGHLGKRLVKKGEEVECGQQIGIVGKTWTPENGWWKDSHLHFAIYVGPWEGRVLPGAYRGGKRTKLSHWKAPTQFVLEYDG